MQTKINKKFLIFVLGILSAIGPFSIDMYLPGFQDLAKDLNTTEAKVTMTLTSYFLGIAIGQLIYGPLLDKYGRKWPLIAGLTVYFVASIGSTFVQQIDMLIVARFLQALGSCAGMVAGNAIIRDVFEEKEMAKAMSSILLVMGIAPIIAPTCGGFFVQTWGWRAIFGFLSIFSFLLVFIIYFFLPETKGKNPHFSLRFNNISKQYFGVITNKQFLIYSLSASMAMAIMFAYVSSASSIFMNIYAFSAKNFAYLFAINASGFIGGSQLNTIMLKKFPLLKLTRMSSFVQMALTLILLILAFFISDLPYYVLLIGLFFTLFLLGFINPNATALAMSPFRENAGSASAVNGFIRMGLAGVVSMVMGQIQGESIVPLCAMLLVLSFLTFGLLRLDKK